MDRYARHESGYGSYEARHGSGLHRAGEAAIAYLRSRRAEHWVMFVAGMVIGALLG